MKKLAIILPGIGYTADRPLLHFCRRIVANHGYEIKQLHFTGFPSDVRGNREKMELCYVLARVQTREQLLTVDLSAYDDILLIGKSIGTVVAAVLADLSDERDRIRQVIYTPLEDTFSVPIRDAVVFTGGDDPWVGGESSRIAELCAKRNLPCHVIPDANHSLETGNVDVDINNLREIMRETERYIAMARGT